MPSTHMRAMLRALRFSAPILLFLLITFAPICWIILSAFTPIDELFRSPLNYIPLHPTFGNFGAVAGVIPLGQEFWNSTVLSVLSAALAVVVCLLAAYAFARIRFPGSTACLLALMFSGFLPGIATIIPLFEMFQSLSLLDTMQGLIILYVSFMLPVSVWIMVNFIRQIPMEIEEAAEVDGAGFPVLLWQIIIPVLRPALATLFLINLIAAWDEFFTPLIFSRSASTATLTLGITQAAVNPLTKSVAWGNEAAMGLMMIVPVFVLSMVFQKQIVEGLMAGALKN
jgi:multiple sugar transport system permease protein